MLFYSIVKVCRLSFIHVWILLKASCNFKSIFQIKLYLLVLGLPKFRNKSANRGEWTKESMIRAVKLDLEKLLQMRVKKDLLII